jgi:hypothetical protein
MVGFLLIDRRALIWHIHPTLFYITLIIYHPTINESIQTVEIALRQYQSALLVVSHDEMFLKHIGASRRVEMDPPCPG